MSNETALLTVSQMSQADSLAIKAGTPSVELMYNAGCGVANAILKRWPMQPVVVLCGPGNNGGDGFVAARMLKLAGWPVRIALLPNVEALNNASADHASQWSGAIERLSPDALGDATLVVDAIFGAGLVRPLDGMVKATLEAADRQKLIIVAIDIPSGIMGDSGASVGAVQSQLTVTFFRKKIGHLLNPGRTLCGETIVQDIGISGSVLDEIKPRIFENDPCLWRLLLPSINVDEHKYERGSALIFGGYPMTGAARLAAEACARIGTGLTSIAVPESAFCAFASEPASIMIKLLKNAEDTGQLLADTRFSSYLIGPGAGVGGSTQENTLKLLTTGKPLVIDADAITSFQAQPTLLFDAIVGPCVLTPHEGEFRRLFSATGDKLIRACSAAAQSGATIVLKGTDTIIASPDGRAVINANAPPSLATAGAGDVLSGMILGLLGQGMDPFLACSAAVWMHGEAANNFGIGLIADDLPDQLPRVRQSLIATSSL
jgi:ADP-dependent NAD(P)H-hydrate dehydratase / NAD(P)H-hydrate epimerase